MLSIIISIIACVTGCVALVISLYRAYLERGNLSISSKANENFYFPKVFTGYATNNQAVISLRLINRSIYPLAIYDVSIKAGRFEYKTQVIDEDKLIISSDVIGFGNVPVTMNVDMNPKLIMPYVIPPFNIYQGTVFLPCFADSDDVATDITIFIRTSRNRRRLKYSTTIKKWNASDITSKIIIVDNPSNGDQHT